MDLAMNVVIMTENSIDFIPQSLARTRTIYHRIRNITTEIAKIGTVYLAPVVIFSILRSTVRCSPAKISKISKDKSSPALYCDALR